MKTTEISPNLLQLTRYRFVNAFLVREQDGFTLIDTTLSGAAEDLIAAAHAAGGEIRRIALTHGHMDHAASLDALREKLGPSVEVLIGERDARILAGEKVVEGKLAGTWAKVSGAPDARLAGGERIGSLEVVPSPGHSPGHVSFLDTRDRSLIAGDVYTAYGRVATTSSVYPRFPLARMGTWDTTMDLQSARDLLTLNPSRLLVGHGPATAAPTVAMERAIAKAGGGAA